MEFIGEISDKDIGLEEVSIFNNKYSLRKAARGLVFSEEGKIALMNVSNLGYYKLPGGGIDEGESVFDAFKREILEEVGAQIKEIKELGLFIEIKNIHNFIQFSYCFSSKIDGDLKDLELTEKEEGAGFKLEFYDVGEALDLIKNNLPKDDGLKFQRLRDISILGFFINKKGGLY